MANRAGSPSSSTDPDDGEIAPDKIFSIVDLPAPLSPTTAEYLARVHVQGDAAQGLHPAVVLAQITDREPGRHYGRSFD